LTHTVHPWLGRCYNSLDLLEPEANNNEESLGTGKMLHRVISLQQHGSLVFTYYSIIQESLANSKVTVLQLCVYEGP